MLSGGQRQLQQHVSQVKPEQIANIPTIISGDEDPMSNNKLSMAIKLATATVALGIARQAAAIGR
jgi:hypothetical protein